jgi:hypothetical protein
MLLDLRSLVEATGAVTYSYTGTGGIVFAGHAAEKIVYAYTASGGIVFGGSARRATTQKYTVIDGGIVFGGVDVEKTTKVYTATGGIVCGGQATVQFISAAPATVGGGVGARTPITWKRWQESVAASAHVKGVRARASVGAVTVSASAGARVSHGPFRHVAVGKVTVEIGPDLVKAEEEELLELLVMLGEV